MSTEDHRAKVRATLERLDPGFLAFADMAKAKFGAKLVSCRVKTDEGWKDLRDVVAEEPKP